MRTQLDIISIALNWLHLLATVVWIGGMTFNIWVLRPSLAIVNPAQRLILVRVVLKRFIYIAWGCVAVLIITGPLIATPSGSAIYGTMLTVKHLIVSVMVIVVAVIGFNLFPKLEVLLPKPSGSFETSQGKPSSRLTKLLGEIVLLVKFNIALGIGVLLITTIIQAL